MSLWGKKSKEAVTPQVNPAVERERMLRRTQWKRLQQHLSDNPLFGQTTFDGLFWIDPFTGQKINAPFDWLTTAKEYFGTSEHWRKGKTLSMADLRHIKWSHHLNENFWNDERYRLFLDNGLWFNPFSRQVDQQIRKDGSVISRGTIGEIARTLAAMPQADPTRLTSLEVLLSKHPELSPQEESEDQEVTIDSGDFSFGQQTSQLESDSPEGFFHGGISAPKNGSKEPAKTAGTDPGKPSERSLRRHSSIPELPLEIDPPAAVSTPTVNGDRPSTDMMVNDHRTVTLSDPNETMARSDSEGGGFHDNNSDLEMAARVQQQLLGKVPDIPNADIALHYEPCHYVGGDFYDFIELKDGRWFILLGDVSGHGVQAALVVQSIIKTLRFICMYATDPEVLEIMATLNDSVKSDLISGQFFTCFAAIVDSRNPDKVVVEAACCGHHPSIVVNAYGPVYMRSVGTKGMAVGLSSGKMMKQVTSVDTIELGPGDCLFVWTDGLSEAMSPEEEEFGDWRTRAACIAHADQDIKDQVDALVEYVLSFSGGIRQDDMSVMALRVPHPDDAVDEEEEADSEDED
ncbi:MAG: hypothetical protein EA402_07575 [Planctomycetota bacterium]|nr:MAG: hypothetical protein EA402_07575 [Planctomycetota bacterium]